MLTGTASGRLALGEVLSQEYKSQSMRLRRSVSTLEILQNRQKARKLGTFWHSTFEMYTEIALHLTKVLLENAETTCIFTPRVKFSGFAKGWGKHDKSGRSYRLNKPVRSAAFSQ